MIDLGRIIGGPDEGDGIIGWMLGLFALGGAAAGAGGGAFDTVGGTSVADGFGASAAAASTGADTAAGFGRATVASEGFFANFFRNATTTDYYVMWDFLGGGATQKAKEAWGKLSKGAQEVAIAHGFMLQQLRAHHLTDLAEEYAKLGINLPDEALLKRAYRALATKLHPDTNPLGEKLTQTLNHSNDTLSHAANISEYREAVAESRAAVEEFLGKFAAADVDWIKKYADAMRAETVASGKLLESKIIPPETEAAGSRLGKWFSELNTSQRIGLAFGSVAAVGLGVYIGVKMKKSHPRHKHPHHQAFMGDVPVAVLHRKPIGNERDTDSPAPVSARL